jgi:peptidyl-tRNA hydrolase
MKVKILYRKNLKMSPGKVAAQAVHAAVGLGHTYESMPVVVLGVSDKRFNDMATRLADSEKSFYIVADAGLTEVEPGTLTCLAYYCDGRDK